ncbi:hypothetical protein EJ05DRAFT_497355 [Pseudovirgaria hyperparasitica]|uniref:Uncharacterized protein n=1 Tax=Pseudovirgaria hyperparasitica TaxID=470096 RepID=A0A6A6WD83_9PEZI|nr:uncharacterized protein EJ05DRAFT_497355 [Pseudovirgaria hyperparasitica]KAF2760792.1 hypothetical protein EJ05DRAFT_497355 [Pseudovirgaria hyperparasitica]
MPLTDRDPNVSGRTSRTSTTSTNSRGFAKSHGPKTDSVPGGAGVMSMLKTSTELGDLGTFSGNSRLPPLPRQSNRRSHTAHNSISSTHSHVSKHGSRHRPCPSASSRRSTNSNGNGTVPQLSYELQTPALMGYTDCLAMLPPPAISKDARSFSLTNTEPPISLSNQASFSSLRSHETISRPRSPFRYPTRLKRPGYRPVSPALSETNGFPPGRHGQPAFVTAFAPMPRTQHYAKPYPLQSKERMPFPEVSSRSTNNHFTQFEEPSRDATFEPAPVGVGMAPICSNLSISNGYTTAAEDSSPDKQTSSNPPSSSAPTTPRDCSPYGLIHDPTVVRDVDDSGGPTAQGGPLYYDYSEQYERLVRTEQVFEPESDSQKPLPVPFGFVHRIKTILEERGTSSLPLVDGENLPMIIEPSGPVPIAELPAEDVVRPVELPADQKIKRITRELIVNALRSSDSGDDTGTSISTAIQNYIAQNESVASGSNSDVAAIASSVYTSSEKRNSALSETPSTQSASTAPEFLFEQHRKNEMSRASPSVPLMRSGPRAATKTCLTDTETIIDATHGTLEHISEPSSPEVSPRGQTQPLSAMRPASEAPQCSPQVVHVEGRFSAPPCASTTTWDVDTLTTPFVHRMQAIITGDDIFSEPSPTCNEDERVEQSEHCETDWPPTFASNMQTLDRPISSPPAVHTRAATPTICYPDSNKVSHHTWSYRKPYASSSYNVQSTLHIPGYLDGASTDMKLSAFRYPGTCLSDVKEESQEGSSLTESQRTSFKFPRTQKLHTRYSVEDLRRSGRTSALSEPVRGSSIQVQETGMIPLLNFSQVDLISKMNEELEVRSLRSADGMSGMLSYRDFLMPMPCRPKSSKTIRERYKSFFASLDEMGHGVEDSPTKRSRAADLCARSRSSSDAMDEVKRLSIPSVGGLAYRLSELLPSFKRYCAPSTPVKSGCSPTEAELSAGNGKVVHEQRSSRRLRALPGLSELVVLDDDVFERMTRKPNERALTSLPEENGEIDLGTAGDGKSTPIWELEAPLPAYLRVHTPPPIFEGDTTLDDSIRRSMALAKLKTRSPRDNRPWNNDNNYPWAGIEGQIEISLPEPVHSRQNSPQPVVKTSLSMLDHQDTGSNEALDLHNISGVGGSTNQDDSGLHEPVKRSVFGCIKDKMARSKPSCDTPTPMPAYSASPGIMGREDFAVDPGDRYPTTGLTPPSTFILDEVRSFFSDDSSQSRKRGIRRHFTSFRSRTRIAPVSRLVSTKDRRVDAGRNCSETPSVVNTAPDLEENDALALGQPFSGTSGMGRIEFRARKMVQRLKFILFKGRQWVRSLNTKRGQGRQKPRHGRAISIQRASHDHRDTTVGDGDVYMGT